MQSPLSFWNGLSVRLRLSLLFVAIKAVPLVVLVWIAWHQTQETSTYLGEQFNELVAITNQAIHKVGDNAVDDAVNALDTHARDEIERLTTDTALRIADFLHQRDADILLAATLPPDATAYRNYVNYKQHELIRHGAWRLNEAGTEWEPVTPLPEDEFIPESGSPDNDAGFHFGFLQYRRSSVTFDNVFGILDFQCHAGWQINRDHSPVEKL
jgi:hypothetical protein